MTEQQGYRRIYIINNKDTVAARKYTPMTMTRLTMKGTLLVLILLCLCHLDSVSAVSSSSSNGNRGNHYYYHHHQGRKRSGIISKFNQKKKKIQLAELLPTRFLTRFQPTSSVVVDTNDSHDDDLLVLLRGGQQQSDPPYYDASPQSKASSSSSQPDSYNYANYNHQMQQNTIQSYENNDDDDDGGYSNMNMNNIPDTSFPPPEQQESDDPLFHEAVQERVDKWKQTQMTKTHSYSEEQMASPRDEDGRVKLISNVSKGSRAFLFFVFMWRNIHLFEIADQRLKGFIRLLTVVPLTLLFIGNLSGIVMSLIATSSSNHSTKKRLKAILNLDKLVEILLLVVYFIRLTVFPSKYIPREMYIAGTLHSVFFLLQLQAFTRIGWDDKLAASSGDPSAASKAYPQHNDKYEYASTTSQSLPYQYEKEEVNNNGQYYQQGYQTASYNYNN